MCYRVWKESGRGFGVTQQTQKQSRTETRQRGDIHNSVLTPYSTDAINLLVFGEYLCAYSTENVCNKRLSYPSRMIQWGDPGIFLAWFHCKTDLDEDLLQVAGIDQLNSIRFSQETLELYTNGFSGNPWKCLFSIMVKSLSGQVVRTPVTNLRVTGSNSGRAEINVGFFPG